MRAIVRLIVVGSLVPLAACASAAAKAAPDRPTLEVPPAPTKVVEASPRIEEQPIDPVPDISATAPTNTHTAKPAATREPARTDPKPEATPATETPAPPVAPVSPPPQLRPGNTPDPSEAARQAQNSIDHARQSLNALNATQFPKGRRVIYDNAQLMLTQAEDALKKSDFENAKKLAEKVELTAKELQGR